MTPVPFPSVKIAGLGCVSPLGIGLPATLDSLLDSRDGISPVRLFSVEGSRARTAGQVDEALSERAVAVSPEAQGWSRPAQMVLLAMDEALRGAPGFVPEQTIVATTSGGMTLGEEFYRALVARDGIARTTRKVRHYVPHEPVLQAMSALGLNTPVRIISNACASGTNALGVACQMLRAGTAQRVLAGGYDTVAELVFAGFDCLKASTEEKCRPFDAARTGLALGEGAAIFCLERGENGICITGYGGATDTHHLTQPHPSGIGPLSTMRKALECAGIEPDSIDYINAHGTGTPLNDASEAQAIMQICPKAAVSSTKGMTGHALGAAGAIEAAFCYLALREGFLPANINFNSTEFPLDIVANTVRRTRPHRVLSNSFGFGGANATVLMEARP